MRTVRAFQLPMLLRALLALLFAIASISHPASAQTQDQIESFRKLPPDQQQAVLEAMRGQAGSAGRRDPQLANPPTTAPAAEPPATGQVPAPEMGPPRIAAGATLLLDVTVPERVPPFDQTTRSVVEGRRDRILGGNAYRLDEQGRLSLPTLQPINLTGLTDVQAAQLLNADPRLDGPGVRGNAAAGRGGRNRGAEAVRL